MISAIFFSVISTGLCFGDEYTTDDGNVVGCDGYDPSGNWVPCPRDYDNSSSSLADEYENIKQKVNPDNWFDSGDSGDSVAR